MERYQIIDLEKLTGIKAHTIRIWEKRYELIKPGRTDTNIRYYNDSDVKKLLNVSTLLELGYKISKIADLSSKEINDIIKNSYLGNQEESIQSSFTNELLQAMLDYNEPAFEKIFSASVTRFGLYKTMLEVIYPFLNKTGILWSSDEACPAQEHFASNIIKRKLQAAIDGLPPPTNHKIKFMLFLPPDEWHEIGLLLSDYMIRSKGYSTVYFGQNMPLTHLQTAIKRLNPNYIITFFTSGIYSEKMYNELGNLLKSHKNLHLLVGGNQKSVDILMKEKSVSVLKSPNDLIKLL